MRVLVACEEWGLVRDAFIAAGHDAISCDLKPTRSPGPHIVGDIREVLYDDWDMLIAHPTCRYLCNSGVRWLYEKPGRWDLMREGAEFFNLFLNAKHIPKRAIENPVMHGHALKIIGRTATQFVQPHWFGDPFKKATGWWLDGLPKLKRTHWMDKNILVAECHNMPPGEERESLRSKTYPNHARQLAQQWG